MTSRDGVTGGTDEEKEICAGMVRIRTWSKLQWISENEHF